MFVFCRYTAALILAFYGMAKLMGSQFTVLTSELDKPMGDVSGFWLTWHYFSYSPVFGTLIALGQIALAIMLCWRKTSLIAAVAGVGVMSTIWLIDLFYGVDPSGTFMALLALVLLLAVVGERFGELRTLFWTSRPTDSARRSAVKAGVIAVVLAALGGFTYWIANHNNRTPTAIDGGWQVVGEDRPFDRVYFEYNRAHMVVFRKGDQWEQHHFEVGPADGLAMWETWLSKGRQIFTGTVHREGSTMTIDGTLNGAATRLKLSKVR
ncbi:hypothetical protein [Allokutzneria oryzae]|uniref:DoxX family protein n=1 Tax=Allokutzneria oryzae TaxID=1378989 RepID=A0ABV5ZW27_9PSEU